MTTFNIQINIRANDDGCEEVFNGGRYVVTTDHTSSQFEDDWNEVKQAMQDANVYWDGPDEIITKMEERGYSIVEDDAETIEVEA